MRLVAERFAATQHYFASAADRAGGGGLLTFFSKSFIEKIHGHIERATTTISAAGRIMTVQVPCDDDGSIAIMNVHNYGLTARLHDARRTIQAQLRKAHSGPGALFLVAGDHSAAATGTTSAPLSPTGHTRACPRNAWALTWKALFDDMIEISTPEVTRFHTCSGAEGEFSATGSTIDHLFISTPRLAIPQLSLAIRPCKPTTHTTTLSDHVAQSVAIAPRAPTRRASLPVPQRVPSHPIYQSDVTKRIDAIPSGLHPADAWRRTRQAMTATARTTLRAALAAKPMCPAQSLTAFMQLSRAIAHGDGRMGRLAIRALPQLADAIAITGDCDIAVVNPQLPDTAATTMVRAAHLAPTDLRDARQSPLGGGTAPTRHRAQQQWTQL